MLYLKDLGDRYDIFIKSWKLDNFSFFYKNKKKIKNICINFDLDNYNNFNDFFAVLRNIYDCKKDLSNITFCINLKNNLFTQEEFENIKKFNRILKTQNSKLYIKEFDVLWDIDEVDKTYKYLNDIKTEILSKNFSPLEQFLYAYKRIAENVYNEDKSLKSLVMSHSIFSLKSNGHIVCRSFSTMLSELVRSLNNKYLHCFESSVKLLDKDDKLVGFHSMNIVMLKDEKYNINGVYSADPTWDSPNKKDMPITLSYCLLPIKDLEFYRDIKISPSLNNQFQYLLSDNNPLTLYSLQNNITYDLLKNQNVLDLNKEQKLFSKKEHFNKMFISNDELEYEFLKNICKKIKQNSTIIPYDTLKNAFEQTLIMQNPHNAKRYAHDVFSASKRYTLEHFLPGTKNCIYTTAKKDFDRIQSIKLKRKKLIERNRELAMRKLQNSREEENTL